MIENVTYNQKTLYYQATNDPDRPEADSYVGHWHQSEVLSMFGIDIPDSITSLTFEPIRSIYAIFENHQVSTSYEYASDHPIMAAIAVKLPLLRKHAQAQFLNDMSDPHSTITYDQATDSFVSTPWPDKEHYDAVVSLNRKHMKIFKHFLELMEVLREKGVLAGTDLSQDLKDDLVKMQNFRDNINWSKWHNEQPE